MLTLAFLKTFVVFLIIFFLDQSVDVPDDLKLDNKDVVAKMTSGFSFKEEITPTLLIETELVNISYNTSSMFQKIQIIETADFGKTLVLDGKTQSAARDEFAYHESLVQPSLMAVGWTLSKNVKSICCGCIFLILLYFFIGMFVSVFWLFHKERESSYLFYISDIVDAIYVDRELTLSQSVLTSEEVVSLLLLVNC